MHLPDSLQAAIDAMVREIPPSHLRAPSESLSKEYRQGLSSRSIFADELKRLAYLTVRFPATYAAAHKVLQETKDFSCKRLLDLGAGPGTAAWAASDLFPQLEEICLVEKSLHAISLGKELSKPFLVSKEWVCQDLESMKEFRPSDLAILSYALGELKRPETLIDRLWKAEISRIAIIEPGTPKGYQTIIRARKQLIELGAHLIAPCPHAQSCPMKQGDWCHFSVRLERTKFHRYLKGGALGYEDEKFSYLIASRIPVALPPFSRILRHPIKASGHVRLSLCTSQGKSSEHIVGRKDGELYRRARAAEWGDPWQE